MNDNNTMKRNIRERDNTMISSSLPDDRRQQPQSGTTKQLSNANHDEKPPSPTPSTSIPLPKSHIHRTPSELQLADDQKKADYEDLRMFSRLVIGIQSRCLSAGYVHPKTKTALDDIVHMKQVKDDELNTTTRSRLHPYAEEDDGWDLAYGDESSSIDTPRPCLPLGMLEKAPSVVKERTPSNVSISSAFSNSALPSSEGGNDQREEEDEDDCLFDLEL